MNHLFLGSFLKGEGLVSEDQILEAAAHQAESNRRLGDLAVEAGLLTPAQVEELLSLQRETDMAFGVLAVSRGFVTKRHMDELLFRQQVHQIHLGEALLSLGHLSPEQFSDGLTRYHELKKAQRRNLEELFGTSNCPAAVGELVQALERAFLRFAACPLKAQGAMATDLDAAFTETRAMLIVAPDGASLHLELSFGPEMLALLRARRAGGGGTGGAHGAGGTDESLAFLEELMEVIRAYLQKALARHAQRRLTPEPSPDIQGLAWPPGACSGGGDSSGPAGSTLPDPSSVHAPVGGRCLRLLLACPAAPVGLTVTVTPAATAGQGGLP